jgi:hypothetical protein
LNIQTPLLTKIRTETLSTTKGKYEDEMHHLEVFQLERTASWNENSLTNMLVECVGFNSCKNISMKLAEVNDVMGLNNKS